MTLEATLKGRRDEVASLITGACSALAASRDWKTYDLAGGFEDLWNLSSRRDCCYDRPSIGLNYALWYHARRTQDVLRLVLPTLLNDGPPRSILDLGCGTGATPWAIALATTSGLDPVPVHVVAVDGSPPMLSAAAVMWDWLRSESPIAGTFDHVSVEWRCRSWTQPDSALDAPDIVASYLFDDSDGTRTAEVASALHRLALHHRARFLHMMSAQQKRALLAEAKLAISGSEHWADDDPTRTPMLWTGPIGGLQSLRTELLAPAGVVGPRLRRAPAFDNQEGAVVARLRRQPSADQLDLPAEKPLILDHLQDEAAEPEDRLTMIVGAAGSGKSRVLIERLARRLEADSAQGSRVLVTTFNKLLIFQLARWFEDRLEGSVLRFDRSGDDGDISFRDPRLPETRYVRFLNWDKVPTRIFDAEGIANSTAFPRLLAKRVEACRTRFNWELSPALERMLAPAHLEAEMHRVIWGLGLESLEDYLVVDRTGRGRQMQEPHRRIVWEVLMGDGHVDTFDHVRMRTAGRAPDETFTDVFVDECQDFTPADFLLTGRLIGTANRLCAAGDETQALHLGVSYRRPGLLRGESDDQNRRWKQHTLRGTYRLPLRICEAVAPLAEHLSGSHGAVRPAGDLDLVDLEAVSSATLGIRPVLIAGDQDGVVEQLLEIVHQYRPIIDGAVETNRVVTFAEGGASLRREFEKVRPDGIRSEVRSMAKIKGLERPVVVWPLSADPPADETYAEWIFTVLTRTTGLLIVVLDSADDQARAVLRLLRRDRLLPWDARAERSYEELTRAA